MALGKKFVVSIVTEDFATTVEVGENIEAGIKVGKCFKDTKWDYLELDFFYDGILLPDPWSDEIHFAASMKAAKEGRVWLEEGHGFVTKKFKELWDGCVLSDEELEEPDADGQTFSEWVAENVYCDVFGYAKVTGGAGYAIVQDPDLAKECEAWYKVTKIGDLMWKVEPR